MEKKPYYITTAIAYTSQKPHIGNSYEIVLTDAIARWRRLQGYDVFFQTGTDEHGQKIENYAKKAGVSPKEYVDKVSAEIKETCDLLNTTYDKFIRTTDDYHIKEVQKIFRKLYDKGDIYKGEYKGMYCTACESFWTESELKNGRCPDCGRPVSPASEEAYFFKLSKYQPQLEKYIEDNPDFIYPESRKKEMINNFLKPGLKDLCVSRTSFKWGIPVDFDDKHIVYVWIDALANYITGIGYDTEHPSEMYKKYWPADVHIVGKDIIRFHTIYWPIMLLALGEPLPKKVYGHPWLLFGEDKMSKSKGNVIYADELVKRFGVDAVRYYLLSEMPFAQDGSITYGTMIERYNSDLANTFGNLVNRTVAMVNKYFDGVLTNNSANEDPDDEFKSTVLAAKPKMEKAFDEFRIADAADAVLNIAKRANKYIDETSPWALAKDETKKDRLATVLYNLIEAIRIIAVELKPFMPETSEKILKQINCNISTYESLDSFGVIPLGSKVGEASPLFARIDAQQAAKEIMEEMKKKEEAVRKEKEKEEKAQENKEAILKEEKISIDDFRKVDIRAAKVINCEKVPKSKKLLKFTLDDGTENARTIVSGIAKWYDPESLIGRKILYVANLKPAVLAGIESNGMILSCENSEDDVKLVFADDVETGARLG